jgi:putative sigma-54 modulation protein
MPSFEETFSRNLGLNRADSKSMKLILDSHNVEVTEAIKEHVNVCVHKLEHMNQRAIEARVNLERDHVGLPENKYKCTMHLYFKGTDMFAEDHESDLYAAIDLVTKKVQQQLRKHHSKIITRHHAGRPKLSRQGS